VNERPAPAGFFAAPIRGAGAPLRPIPDRYLPVPGLIPGRPITKSVSHLAPNTGDQPKMISHKRAIVGLATVLAATAVAVGSGATFTSQTANAESSFVSGTLTQTNSKDGVAIVTGANLKPGDVRSGEVTISNTGSLAGVFTLKERNASNSFEAGSLNLTIQDTAPGGAEVFDGDLGSVPAAGIALGTYAADGGAHTYRFTVTLSADAGNDDQGESAGAEYVWDAVQE
jgi:spore coat-associated protein N